MCNTGDCIILARAMRAGVPGNNNMEEEEGEDPFAELCSLPHEQSEKRDTCPRCRYAPLLRVTTELDANNLAQMTYKHAVCIYKFI